MSGYEPIGALVRGLRVLHALNENGPMTVGELHKSKDIAKPTVVRVIQTLQSAGYVGQRDRELRYAVTNVRVRLARIFILGPLFAAEQRPTPVMSDESPAR